MIDLTMASLMPILISSVTAVCFSYIFNGSNSLFQFTMDGAWQMDRVPAYILLGLCLIRHCLWSRLSLFYSYDDGV